MKILTLIQISLLQDNVTITIVIGILIIIAFAVSIYKIYFLKKRNEFIEEESVECCDLKDEKTLEINTENPIFVTNKPKQISQPNQFPKTTAKDTEVQYSFAQDTQITEEPSQEPSKPKHIGYEPINIFAQTEPLDYPYVVMPKKNDCIIKFPRKGRNGRKGYKENSFYKYLQLYFTNDFQLYNDRFVLTKNNTNRYEPDFSLIDEKNGINIFMDIEIDEPYEGLNDINKREVIHCQNFDTNRNNEFTSRGWIVVRFAEIQVHQNPDGCCRFIADVIKSVNSNFKYPNGLLGLEKITSLRQWTKEEARQWSNQKYREQYLGIDNFGITEDIIQAFDCVATVEDILAEKEVVDEKIIVIPETQKVKLSNHDIINSTILSGKYIAFNFNGGKTVVKPINCSDSVMVAYCYIKNMKLSFDIADMKDICVKENYYTQRFVSPNLGIQRVANIMNIVISNQIFVRMKYTRREWTRMLIDPETGEFILDKTEAEESIRTVSNIRIDSEGFGDYYIKTYCHKREDERTFRFDRISELELLDL